MDQFDDAGCIISKLQVILGCPDLGHHLAEKQDDKTDEQRLDQKFEYEEILLEKDHLVDKKIAQDDDGDIDDAVANQHGRQQGLRFFEERNDPLPGVVLFGFKDIDVLECQRKKRHFGAGYHKGKNEQEKDYDGQDGRRLGVDYEQPERKYGHPAKFNEFCHI